MTMNADAINPGDLIEIIKNEFNNPEMRGHTKYLSGTIGVGKTQAVERCAAEYVRWSIAHYESIAKTAEGKALVPSAEERAEILKKEAGDFKPKTLIQSGLLRMIVLSAMESADVGGARFLDHKTQKTMIYAPDWMTDANEWRPITLFFDELTSVDSEMQAPCYSVFLQKAIAHFYINEETMIFAAGNGEDDAAIYHPISSAVIDRMDCYFINSDVNQWLKWGIENNIHGAILAHIRQNGERLNRSVWRVANDKTIAPSPRGWGYYINNILKNHERDEVNENQYQLMARLTSHLGQEDAGLFLQTYAQADILLHLDEWLDPKVNIDKKLKEQIAIAESRTKENEKREKGEAGSEGNISIIGSQIFMLCYGLIARIDENTWKRVLDVIIAIYFTKIPNFNSADIATACMEESFAAIAKKVKNGYLQISEHEGYNKYMEDHKKNGVSQY